MAGTTLTYPYELEGGTKAVASEVMGNFYAIQTAMAGVNTEINNLTQILADLKEKPTSEMMSILYRFEAVAPTGAFPLWTGQTLTNAKTLYPQFWKKLTDMASKGQVKTVADNATYEAKLKEFGQCAAFYIDELNGHIRLPKVTRFISSISDLADYGEYNDTVKKHNHKLKATPASGNRAASVNRYLGSGTDNSKSDMFWSDTYTLENTAAVAESGEEEGHPKHVRLYMYLQVVNNTADISRFDVNALAEELNHALTELKNKYDLYAVALDAEFQRIKEQIADTDLGDYYTKEEIDEKKSLCIDVSFSPEIWVDRTDYAGDFGKKAFMGYGIGERTFSNVMVTFNETDAMSGNFSPVCDWTLANNTASVMIYAKEVPSETIVATLTFIY